MQPEALTFTLKNPNPKKGKLNKAELEEWSKAIQVMSAAQGMTPAEVDRVVLRFETLPRETRQELLYNNFWKGKG